jgi:hypothetical protein
MPAFPVPQWDFAAVPNSEGAFFPMKDAFAKAASPNRTGGFLLPPFNPD